jgi:uncharacterized protein with HEPN domain
MRGELGDKQRLLHILDACKKILLATKDFDQTRFVDDFIVNAAVCNFIMIIGEASATISKEFKERHKEFDWL